MTALANFLLAASGAAGAIAAGALLDRKLPTRRTALFVAAFAVAAAGGAGVIQHYNTARADQPATVRPLPDPDDCVQLGWLDGAWRCITEEEAG